MASGFDVYDEYKKKKGQQSTIKIPQAPVVKQDPMVNYAKNITPARNASGYTAPKLTNRKFGIGMQIPAKKAEPQPLPYAGKVSANLPQYSATLPKTTSKVPVLPYYQEPGISSDTWKKQAEQLKQDVAQQQKTVRPWQNTSPTMHTASYMKTPQAFQKNGRAMTIEKPASVVANEQKLSALKADLATAQNQGYFTDYSEQWRDIESRDDAEDVKSKLARMASMKNNIGTDMGQNIASMNEYQRLRGELEGKGINAEGVSDWLRRNSNVMEAYYQQQRDAARADEHPILESLKTVPQSLYGGTGALAGVTQSAMNSRTGEYRPIDTMGDAFDVARSRQTVRGTVGEKVAQAVYEGTGSQTLANAANFLYGTAMSGLDSALVAAVGGVTGLNGAASIILGSNAASETMMDVVNRGGSTDQAVAAGILSGAAETIFEKVSIEGLISKFKSGEKGFRAFLKNATLQGVSEAGEEMATEIANVIADYYVNGGLSEIEQMRQSGMSDVEIANEIAKRVGVAGAGGFLMGFVGGGVASVFNRTSLSLREQRALNALSEKTGVNIQIDDDIKGSNGYFDRNTNTLHISRNSNNAVYQVAAHEITHSIESNPAEWRQLYEIANANLSEDARSKLEYVLQKTGYTDADMQSEVVSHYVQQCVTDIKSFEQLVGVNRNLAQRIVDAFDSFIRKITMQRSVGNDSDTEYLREIMGDITPEQAQQTLAQMKKALGVKPEEPANLSNGDSVNNQNSLKLTDQERVRNAAEASGYNIHAYHGTGRADRVGNEFLPERATSGPMAFFTDSREIAENYARDKNDTSLAYDEEYADYYSQFRVNRNGKSIKVQDLWNSMSPAQKQRVKEAGKHITLDDEAENIIWDDNATHGLGNWDAYTLNQHRGNAIEALIDSWLEGGTLYGNEGDFLKVLEMVGITGVEYRDPDARYEKVYDTYLNIQNPFDTATVDDNFLKGLKLWWGAQDHSAYKRETAGADMWDKNSRTVEEWIEKASDDIKNGTSHAWTSIPDAVTDYLKSQGYDGIKDRGGKNGGDEHTVYIPFAPEQIKSAETVTMDDNGNVIPLENRFDRTKRDIRYSRKLNREALQEMADWKRAGLPYAPGYIPKAQQLPRAEQRKPKQIPYATGYNAAETPTQPALPMAEELNVERQKNAQRETQPLFHEALKRNERYDFEEASNHKDDVVPEGRIRAKVDQVLDEKRKTFDEWMNVAKEIGIMAAEDGNDIVTVAYSTWEEIHPNRKDRLNRQGQRYVPFDFTDWRNAIVDAAIDTDPYLGERMRWNDEEGRYEDFDSFWWGHPNMTEQQAWQAFNSNDRYGPNTVGSAQVNPESYSHLQNEYGVVAPGENPARVIDMPVKDAQGKTNSLFARTIAESESMPNEMVPEWEQAVASGEFSHDIATDKAATRHAERELNKGWDYAMRQWQAVSEGDKVATKNDLALGQLLLANAMKDGDTQTAMKLAAELCAEATRAGRAVQSFRLLKKMTPEGMLYYLQKTVNNLNSDFEGRKGFEGIKIDEGMAERLGKATTREEMNAIVDEIKQDIAAQTPVTWYDKWNAWRYLSMLGNPTTQVRNVLGNALFVPVVKAKNLIATGIEAAWKKTGHLPYATKAVLTAKDKGLVDFADNDFSNVVQEIQGGGKYSDKDDVLGKRKIFKNRFLEGWRNLTNTVMDKGDEIFSRQHYRASLAQYMKANNLTPDTITTEQLNRARNYAIQEAQRATYRDASSVASLINQTKRKFAQTANNKDNAFSKRAAARAGEVLLEGFVPFTKTPVNIVKRGIEYSPIGLAQGTINLVRSVKNGDVDAAAAIDRMAAGLTGSSLLALGAWFASLGLVSGGPGEDDREEKYKGMLGGQDYALNLGDKTYTIDWAAPEALPFFTGVELYKEMQSKDGITLADTIGLISAMSDPIVELSMLSSVNSTFESIKYSQGDALSTVAGNLITSYLGQGVPTIGGKAARTIDETSRQTYYDPNKTGIVKSADVFRQKVQAKIPFAANALPERVDLWGRTEKNAGGNIVGRFFYNMLSPGYLENKNVTKVDNELMRLAEATSDSNVYPDTADKTFKVNGESVKLDSKQYTQFAKTKGQTAFEILEAAVDSSTYKKMTDAEKADFVKDVYEYANAKAKAEISDYQLDGKNAKIAQAEQKGIKPAQYLAITGGYDKDGNGSVTQEEVKTVLDKTNLTTAQKAYMWKLQNKSWKTNPYE